MRGYTFIRPWGLSHRIPYCMDTEISPPHPESWCAWLPSQTFSESPEINAWMRDCGEKYPGGSYSHDNDYSTEVCGERCNRTFEGHDSQLPEEKVWLVEEGVLERKCGLVTWIFRFDSWSGRRPDNQIHTVAE